MLVLKALELGCPARVKDTDLISSYFLNQSKSSSGFSSSVGVRGDGERGRERWSAAVEKGSKVRVKERYLRYLLSQ